MTFSEFVKMLYPFCGAGSKTAAFVLSLFNNIMEDPSNDDDILKAQNDQYNPLAKRNLSTLEKYFSGLREISKKNASIILNHLDKGKFEEYISNLPVDSISLLGKALRTRGFDVPDHKVPSKCADIFSSIIENLAATATSISPVIQPFPGSSKPSNAIPATDLYLLMEANSLCPSCGKTLVSDKNNSSLGGYVITPIIPPSPTEEQIADFEDLLDLPAISEAFNNKIALCLDCSNRYTSNTTRDECEQMMDIKERLHRNFAAYETLDKMYLEEQIEAIIRQIANVSQDQLSDPLNLTAVRVKEKVPASNVPLIIKMESYVVHYYNFIKSVFSQLEREDKLNFEDVAADVRRTFRKLHADGLSQDEIFDKLVDWFKNNTKAQSVPACEIVVAFFVQNCEVFHALTQQN